MKKFEKRVIFLINFDPQKNLNENNYLMENLFSENPKTNSYQFNNDYTTRQDNTYLQRPIFLPKKQDSSHITLSTEQSPMVDNSDENSLYTYDLYLEPQPPNQVETTIQSPGTEPEVAYMLPYDSNRAKIEICEKNKFPIQYTWIKPPSKYNFYQGEGKKISAGCSCDNKWERPKYLYKDMDETNPTYEKFLSKKLNNMGLWMDPKKNPLPDSTKKQLSGLSNLQFIYLNKYQNQKDEEILNKIEKISKGNEWCYGKKGHEFLNQIYILDLEDWKKNYKRAEDFENMIIRVSLLFGGLEFLLGASIVKSFIIFTGFDITLVFNKLNSAKNQENDLLKKLDYIEAGLFAAFGVLSLSVFGVQLLSKYGITKTILQKLSTPFRDPKIANLKKTLEYAKIYNDGKFIPYATANIYFGVNIALLRNSTLLRNKLWVAITFRQILSISKITISIYFGGKTILCTVSEVGVWLGLKGYDLQDEGNLKNIPKTQKNAYNILKSTNQQLEKNLEDTLEKEKNNLENVEIIQQIKTKQNEMNTVQEIEINIQIKIDSLVREINKSVNKMPPDSIKNNNINKIDYTQKIDSIL